LLSRRGRTIDAIGWKTSGIDGRIGATAARTFATDEKIGATH
jgi:hypothetical protein